MILSQWTRTIRLEKLTENLGWWERSFLRACSIFGLSWQISIRFPISCFNIMRYLKMFLSTNLSSSSLVEYNCNQSPVFQLRTYHGDRTALRRLLEVYLFGRGRRMPNSGPAWPTYELWSRRRRSYMQRNLNLAVLRNVGQGDDRRNFMACWAYLPRGHVRWSIGSEFPVIASPRLRWRSWEISWVKNSKPKIRVSLLQGRWRAMSRHLEIHLPK